MNDHTTDDIFDEDIEDRFSTKSYSYRMNEISSKVLYERLMSYGLFNSKIPPIISSKKFFEVVKENKIPYTKQWEEYIKFDSLRNNGKSRELGIPNPFAYNELCKFLRDNWGKLQEYYAQITSNQEHKHKVSRTHLRLSSHNSLFVMNYDNWKTDGSPIDKIKLGKHYVVYADISTCYPSIYTHSIPWALVGKKEAKKNSNNKNSYYNKLDKLVSNTMNGQTHGIMIGPDASNLISEIILCAVDYELVKNGWEYVRHIDDYTCYVETYEKAEEFIRDLREQLSVYDLLLNQTKIRIEKLPEDCNWKDKIEILLQIKHNNNNDYKSTRSYMNFLVGLCKEYDNNLAILNYGIKSAPKFSSYNAIDYFVNEYEHWTIIYPYLITIAEEYIFDKYKVSVENNISEFINILYKQEIKNKNYECIYWCIYYANKYNFEITDLDEKNIILDSNSCLTRLFAYIYFGKRNNQERVNSYKEKAKQMLKNETEFGQNWLFVYEVLTIKDFENEKIEQTEIRINNINYEVINKEVETNAQNFIESMPPKYVNYYIDTFKKQELDKLENKKKQEVKNQVGYIFNQWIKLKENNVSFISNPFVDEGKPTIDINDDLPF